MLAGYPGVREPNMAILLPPEQHRVLQGNRPLRRGLKEVSGHGGYSDGRLNINKSPSINEDFRQQPHPSEAWGHGRISNLL